MSPQPPLIDDPCLIIFYHSFDSDLTLNFESESAYAPLMVYYYLCLYIKYNNIINRSDRNNACPQLLI